MKASEALDLTRKSLDVTVLVPLREHVFSRVSEAAQQGKRSVCHPMYGYKGEGYIAPEVMAALWKSLQEDGYSVHHHEDPDPGRPGSGPYDEIRW